MTVEEAKTNPLPPWARHLSTRLKNVLLNADLPKVTKAAVRSKGEAWWLRQPNVGRRTARELCEAIDGWPGSKRAFMRLLREEAQRIDRAAEGREANFVMPPLFGKITIQYGVPITAQEAGLIWPGAE